MEPNARIEDLYDSMARDTETLLRYYSDLVERGEYSEREVYEAIVIYFGQWFAEQWKNER